MSKTLGYLKGVHVLVATPDNLAEVLQFPEFSSMFDDLKAVAIDEVDACFKVPPLPRSQSKQMSCMLGPLNHRACICLSFA